MKVTLLELSSFFLPQHSERLSHLILMSCHKSKQRGQVFSNSDMSEVEKHCEAVKFVPCWSAEVLQSVGLVLNNMAPHRKEQTFLHET